MDKQKLGQEPAFPVIDDAGTASIGISKRFYAACAAMQGILASDQNNDIWFNPGVVAGKAYEYADELLKQENQ